jgi:poly(3-hydroxybutyrate) depolymerase
MAQIMLQICLAVCITECGYGQMEGIKYKDQVFSEVTIAKDVLYSTNITKGVKKKFYYADVYRPEADTNTKRPLIIWMHGGGFKFGSKKSRGIPLWSETFARRGYVCAAINYRLRRKFFVFNFQEIATGCYEAIKHVQQAVAFFKENYEQFGIDTNRIILAGNSAGGMLALQSTYGNYAQLAKFINRPDSNLATYALNPNSISAIINFWGGIFQIDWVKNARIPIVSSCT